MTVHSIRPGGFAGRSVLIVENNDSLAGFLSRELREASFTVDVVSDGEAAVETLRDKRKYDLVILELNLPGMDGITLLETVRPSMPRLPMLVLTSRTGVEDRVLALRSGADDCVVKPFSFLELLARVEALMRRNSGVIPNTSNIADLELHREQRRVKRNGRKIDLTPREFGILEYMMRNTERPVPRETLFEEVWSAPYDPSTNIVDVYMKYVRDKVDLAGERKLIHTVRGIGYELRYA